MEPLQVSVWWTIRERAPGEREFRVVQERKNIVTNTGLSLLAQSLGGTNAPPKYLVIDTTHTTLNAAYAAGVSSIDTVARIDQSGDTQLVLGPGLVGQETVTFSAVSGTGPYTYTLSSPTVNAHNSGDAVVRAPTVNDVMAYVTSELSPDTTNQRAGYVSGYANGNGNWTLQFYLTGIQAIGTFYSLGLSETITPGAGQLHNHFVSGYVHAQGYDVEIDVAYTLSNV